MTPSLRETVLRLALPGVLILAAYFVTLPLLGDWAQAINPRRSRDDLQTRLRNDRARDPRESGLQLAAAARQQSAEQRDRLQERKAELEERWRALTRQLADSSGRTAVLAEVEPLLARHGLVALEQGPAEDRSGQSHIPASLQPVLQLLSDRSLALQARVVRFRFVGRYPDVLEAVAELAQRDWPVIPLSLSMDPVENWNTDLRTWTLLLWI
ncbi:MAG: hypothetical protein NZ700_17665 [Gemmataceae bacterium]|nr:hypothetical protein [Gemmataceae bacterium]MDW8267414.1 hypothetical protein [Gemmataceae bacterium]